MRQITKQEFINLVANKPYTSKQVTLGGAVYTNYYNRHKTNRARDGHIVAAIRETKLEGIKYFTNKS